MKEAVFIAALFMLFIYLRAESFAKLAKWENWCDVHFPFMSDQQVRHYVIEMERKQYQKEDHHGD